jgi:hypothetical protein
MATRSKRNAPTSLLKGAFIGAHGTSHFAVQQVINL